MDDDHNPEPGRFPRCIVLVNPEAGRRGDEVVDRVSRLLGEVGAGVRVSAADALTAEIERLAGLGVPVIGVSGGDGTLRAAASRLVGRSTALLPVPTGTLNHFARRLGIGRIEDAAAALLDGSLETVPVGFVDDRVFLNTATFGLYADVVRKRESLRGVLTKWPAAVLAFWAVLLRMRQLDVVLQVEGEYLRRTTPLLWVGIGWGSFPRILGSVERRSSPDLEIVVLRPGSRLGAAALLARLIVHLLRGRRPIDDPALEIIHARSLLVHGPQAIGVTLDGEVIRCEPPLFVTVQDGALTVLRAGRSTQTREEISGGEREVAPPG